MSSSQFFVYVLVEAQGTKCVALDRTHDTFQCSWRGIYCSQSEFQFGFKLRVQALSSISCSDKAFGLQVVCPGFTFLGYPLHVVFGWLAITCEFDTKQFFGFVLAQDFDWPVRSTLLWDGE